MSLPDSVPTPVAEAFAPEAPPLRLPAVETRLERLVYRWSAAAVVVAVALGVVGTAREAGGEAVRDLAGLAAASVFLVGKFVVFGGVREGAHLGPWELASMVWLIDVLAAFALASGLSKLERAPLLGRWLRKARAHATAVLLEYPRIERMAFAGVALLVFLPIAATGAVTGSFAARLLGLSRLVGVVAVAVGSAATALVFALLASFIGERAEMMLKSPVLTGASALALAVFGWLGYRRIRMLLRT